MHPQSAYTDQTPDALRLTLVEGSLEMSQFVIWETGEVSSKGLSVTASVIGASHVITYRRNGQALHEVFACDGCHEGTSTSLNVLLKRPTTLSWAGMDYEFTAWFTPWRMPEDHMWVDWLATLSGGTDAFHVVQEFPQGNLSVKPMTIISGRIHSSNGNAVETFTVHSYPGQGLVTSRTTITQQEEQ